MNTLITTKGRLHYEGELSTPMEAEFHAFPTSLEGLDSWGESWERVRCVVVEQLEEYDAPSFRIELELEDGRTVETVFFAMMPC